MDINFNQLRIRDKIFIGIVVVGLVFLVINKITGLEGKMDNREKMTNLKIGDKPLKVQTVVSAEDMQLGLGARESLSSDEGMLFFHIVPGRYEYLMRNMKFNLDFIFINKNKVVDIAMNVPFDYSGIIVGGTEYSQVIEVNAGWVEKNGIQLGDEVSF